MSSPFGFIPPVGEALNEELADEGLDDAPPDPDVDSVENDQEASRQPTEDVELDGKV